MSEIASTFRTAVEIPAPAPRTAPGDSSHAPDTHESSLFATYEADQKKPYTAKYFDVENVWDKEPSLGRDLREIEAYVREQVSLKKVDNSTKAADKFLKELERKAGLTTYESIPHKITKLIAYLDYRKMIES